MKIKKLKDDDNLEIIFLRKYRKFLVFQKYTFPSFKAFEYIKKGLAVLPEAQIRVYPLYDFYFINEDKSRFFFRESQVIKAIHAYQITFLRQIELIDETKNNEEVICLFSKRQKKSFEKVIIEKTSKKKEEIPIKYFLFKLKGGHVGQQFYYPICLGVSAYSYEDAEILALALPRVKHKIKSDILDVKEVSIEEYSEQQRKNESDEYFKIHNNYDGKAWKNENRHLFCFDDRKNKFNPKVKKKKALRYNLK